MRAKGEGDGADTVRRGPGRSIVLPRQRLFRDLGKKGYGRNGLNDGNVAGRKGSIQDTAVSVTELRCRV